jgi:FdhE protein
MVRVSSKMNNWWDKQIQRAKVLDDQSHGSQSLVKFYGRLLKSQKDVYDYLRGCDDWLPSGQIDTDLSVLCDGLSPLLDVVQIYGPEPLAVEAKCISQGAPGTLTELLIRYWNSPSDVQFFGKASLQPYLKWLAEAGGRPRGREPAMSDRQCPFCGGNPQVSFLSNKETAAESGNRDLICGTCLTSWEFRRVVCANCGEERPAKLGYFHSPEFDHVRIEACDSCMHYIKGVDLTRLGHAVPLVDEIHAAALDLWARDHGYKKIELNLVGV